MDVKLVPTPLPPGIEVHGAPPPGSTHPGDLYVDLQSRTLWLGVDAAVDATEAVLISDIISLMGEITDSETETKAYVDTQITTRAPTVHSHTSSQITDFTAAVTAVATSIPSLSYVRGMVMMYSGLLSDIGTGPLAGWALCNGSNGTPDLRDRFILGAGNRLPGAVNPNPSFLSGVAGGHTHTSTGHILTIAELPSHQHGGQTGYISHDHTHFVSGNTGTESHDHQHGGVMRSTGTSRVETGNDSTYSAGATDGRNQAHYHAISIWSGTASDNHYHAVPAEGGGAAHSHDISYDGDHQHTITSANIRDTIPYYALAFIMKL